MFKKYIKLDQLQRLLIQHGALITPAPRHCARNLRLGMHVDKDPAATGPTVASWKLREIFLINVTGRDRPGLTARLAGILGQFGVTVLDIGQAVIHDHLSLGMMVEIPSEQASSPVLKEVLYAAHELGIAVRFEPISVEAYEAWVAEQGRERHIIVLLGRGIAAAELSRVAETLAGHGLHVGAETLRVCE